MLTTTWTGSFEMSKVPDSLRTPKAPEDGPDGSTSSNGRWTISTETETIPKGMTPYLRMSWRATSPSSASTMCREIADMLRGAETSAPLHPCWTVHWTVWQGMNELKQSPSSTRYGATLWLSLLGPEG